VLTGASTFLTLGGTLVASSDTPASPTERHNASCCRHIPKAARDAWSAIRRRRLNHHRRLES
jgi:hypothetical protein